MATNALLLLVLVALVALLALVLRRHAPPRGYRGGAPPRRGVYRGGWERKDGSVGHALRAHRSGHGPQESLGPPPSAVLESPPLRRGILGPVTGGGKKKKKAGGKKPWTSYGTWKELHADKGACAAYWAEVAAVLGRLDLDWSGVRAELGDKLYDRREWVGRINLVGGVPKIVELRPSPHAVGEGPLPKGAAAMVPAELVAEVEAKPALFFFHTHPGEEPGSVMPSPIDVVSSAHTAYTGRFAADLIFSPYATLLYTPNAGFRRAVWRGPQGRRRKPAGARLAMLRRASDVLGAFGGSRSWQCAEGGQAPGWPLGVFERMMAQYGFDYVVFPTDRYAWANYRQIYTTPEDSSDHESAKYYLEKIGELERKIQEQALLGAEAAPAGAYGDLAGPHGALPPPRRAREENGARPGRR